MMLEFAPTSPPATTSPVAVTAPVAWESVMVPIIRLGELVTPFSPTSPPIMPFEVAPVLLTDPVA